MIEPNKIAAGLNAWLSFEQMCNREPLFSESYWAFPIGQLLAARYGGRLSAEFVHPVLGPRKTGSGDKPRIDFAVANPDGSVELVIETKWLSSSKTLHRDVMRDIVRLELARDKLGCAAWFILAGTMANFESLVGNSKFRRHPNHLGSSPLLPHGKTREGILRLNPVSKYRKDLVREVLEPFGGIQIRNFVHLTRFGPHPESPASGNSLVVYLWRLNDRGVVDRFVPPVVPKKTRKSNQEIEA